MSASYTPVLAHGGYDTIAVYGAILALLLVGIWKFVSWAIGTPPASKTSGLVTLATVASLGEAELIMAQLEEKGISAYVPEADQTHVSPFSHSFTVYVAAGDVEAAKVALKGEVDA